MGIGGECRNGGGWPKGADSAVVGAASWALLRRSAHQSGGVSGALANNSFRGAARSLQVVCEEASRACPSLWSIRNWVLRLGLYELERPKEVGRDWVWILDHTIQVGTHKALLMLKERAEGARQCRYAEGIGQYLNDVESKLRPGERLLGSSDVIESLFGKYKLLIERSPQKAITRLILAIGALTSRRTPELIRQALETVKMESVEKWFRKYIGESPGSIRRKAFARSGTILV